MPPVSRLSVRQRSLFTPKKSKAKTKYNKYGRKKYQKYKTGNRNKAKRGAGIIRIQTLLPKNVRISVNYKKTFLFTDMGHGGGSTSCLLRAVLMDPISGGPGASLANGIVSVVSNLKTGAVAPTVTQQSYNDQANLSDVLADYFNDYSIAYVTSSKCTWKVRAEPNQINIGQSFENYPASGNIQTSPLSDLSAETNHAEYMRVSALSQTLDGNLNVWCVRQRGSTNLYDGDTEGTVPIQSLKSSVPGLKMRKLIVTPHGTSRGVTFTNTYMPARAHGFHNTADNISSIQFWNNNDGTSLNNQSYLGICGNQEASSDFKPANVIVECQVAFNVLFDRRKNTPDSNIPVPQHAGTHTEL